MNPVPLKTLLFGTIAATGRLVRVAVDAAGNIGAVLAPNSGVDIGDVGVTSLPVSFDEGVSDATTQRAIVEALDSPVPLALGIADIANMGTLAFDGSVTVALDPDSSYLLISTEDCYFHLTDGAEAATTSSLYLPAYQYLSLRTGATIVNLYAIKRVTAGVLHYCKMVAAG